MTRKVALSPDVVAALEKLLDVVHAMHRPAHPRRSFRAECCTRFARVRIGLASPFILMPNGDAYQSYWDGGNCRLDIGRPLGNLVTLVALPQWQRLVRFQEDRFAQWLQLDVPDVQDLACDLCKCSGGDSRVRKTRTGALRCRQCRGKKQRHFSSKFRVR